MEINPSEVIYLLHFDQPISHARHYLGSTLDVRRRVKQHYDKCGAAITRAVRDQGGGWIIAATFAARVPGSIRKIESALKKAGNNARHCPICNPDGYRAPFGTIEVPVPNEGEK